MESSTYGSEMVAARLEVEQVMDLRYKLRMLGVPIKEASVMIGDNQSTITSCSIPSSNLKKRHNAITYHRVGEAVAAGIVELRYIKGKYNLADAMTKPLNGEVHYKLWKDYIIKPLQETEECQPIEEKSEAVCNFKSLPKRLENANRSLLLRKVRCVPER